MVGLYSVVRGKAPTLLVMTHKHTKNKDDLRALLARRDETQAPDVSDSQHEPSLPIVATDLTCYCHDI
jgi:hypothetical protein